MPAFALMPCHGTALVASASEAVRRDAERRDAFRWGAAGDLLLARRELGRRRRHAAEAMLRRAEAAVLEAWEAAEGLAGDLGARDRAFSRIADLIAAARAGLGGPGTPDLAAAQARVTEALGALWALEEAAAPPT